jgi:diguanylate cyclase (GGDEF)-like protein
MTAIPSDIGPAVERESISPAGSSRLPRRAAVFLVLLAAATAASAGPFVADLPHTAAGQPWWTFAALAVAAAVTHLFVVRSPRNQSYHTSVAFLLGAAILLPPELIVLVCVLQNIPEWLKERYPWFIQSFNICNYTLSTLAASATFHGVMRADGATLPGDARFAAAAVAACGVFVLLNHLLLGTMLRLARGHSLRETGLFSTESLTTELVLTAMGVALAAFWTGNPWLIPVALSPLLVVHRSLSVPALQAEARVDPKTGLFNARHFAAALGEEIARATRVDRPLSLIMADLDLLRDVNNSYGHLAGDAVLQGLAGIFRAQLRHYDVPARFGGEEFSILLPETSPEQALEIAERIRQAVSGHLFEVETSSEPIRVTVSIGVAGFPRDATDANELIHQADLAVYRAKLQGRNRVLGASSEPLLLPAERSSRLAAVPGEEDHTAPLPVAQQAKPREERRVHPRPHALHGPRFLSLSGRLTGLVTTVSLAGGTAGVAGLLLGQSSDLIGLLALVALVGVGQALALEVAYGSDTISVAAVGALAGAAVFGPRAALPIAVATVAVEWSARRDAFAAHLFNLGTLSLAGLAAAGVFWLASGRALFLTAAGLAAGAA